MALLMMLPILQELKYSQTLVPTTAIVRFGIEAPMEIPVMRQEIYNEISQNNQAAAGLAKAKVKLKVKELVKS